MAEAETPYAQQQAEFGQVFGTPMGRRVLQQILEAGGVYEADADLPSDAVMIRQGSRALALDIATLAGALPEVPGSGGKDLPEQPRTALKGGEPPEGDGGQYAE